MEYLDVLDSNGQPTGEKKLKSEVHQNSDWHRGGHVWIINSKGELLIQKRDFSTSLVPGQWDISCAGHIPSGEDLVAAATREMKEELGLDFDQSSFVYLFTVSQEYFIKADGFTHRSFDSVYLIQSDVDLKNLKLEEGKISEVKLTSFKDLEETISKGDKDFVPHPEEYRKLFEDLHKRYT